MKCLLPPPFLNPKASLFWLKCPLNALSSVTVYVTLCSGVTLYFQNHKGTPHKIFPVNIGLRNCLELRAFRILLLTGRFFSF